jgi:carboxyl-terminal processing protease
LDYDRTYFLDSDVESFRDASEELDDELRDGHLAFAYEVHELFKERVRNRVAYIENLLSKGFDFTLNETYSLKRKEAPWPKDEAESDELWRKKVKHELLSRRVARQIREEAPPPEETSEDEEDYQQKSPEELVLKMHRQFLEYHEGHDAEWVLQTYLNAFAQAYDPHSAYMAKRETEDFGIQMKLSLTGIGAVLTYDDGAAKIVRLIPGGPAERDGRLEPGDRIIAVGQGDGELQDIMFKPLYQSVRLIRGNVGSRVALRVIPASDITHSTVRRIELVRDTIRLEERAAKTEIYNVPSTASEEVYRIGVLTLPEFYADQQGRRLGNTESRSSAQDARRLLKELNEQAVDGVLLDLRNNGGGSLPDAVEMTGLFIDHGPIVQVKVNRNQVRVLRDPDSDLVYGGPLVVLVNRMSASASEILAAALQDYGRAIIVGDSKTHGKGTVQTVFPVDRLDDRFGSLKVTTAGFYRIDGHSTQVRGVTPDVVVSSAMDVTQRGEEFLPNVMEWSFVSPTRYRPVGDMNETIAALRTRSGERLAEDEAFEAYRDLVHQLEERLNRETIDLNEQVRLEQARKEKALDRLQDTIQELLAARQTGQDSDSGNNDLILGEALFILRDLIEVGAHTLHVES